MTNQTAILGDCVSLMSDMEDNSFEICITSPPYNIGISYADYKDNKVGYEHWMINWLTHATRISKRGVMLNIDTKASEQNNLYSLLGKISNRFKIQNSIVWVKSIYINGTTTGHVKPINSKRYLNAAHELVLHIVDGPTVEIDRLAIGVPYTDKSNIARFGEQGRPDLKCGGGVWFIPYETRTAKKLHPASYPLELAKRMISYAGGNGAIIDPFVGSGTSLLAAKSLGREALGIDISQEYVDMSNESII